MWIASLSEQIVMTDLRTIWPFTRSIYYWIYRPDGEQKMKGWLTWHEVIIWSSRQNIIAETGYYKIAKIPGSTCIGVCVCVHIWVQVSVSRRVWNACTSQGFIACCAEGRPWAHWPGSPLCVAVFWWFYSSRSLKRTFCRSFLITSEPVIKTLLMRHFFFL